MTIAPHDSPPLVRAAWREKTDDADDLFWQTVGALLRHRRLILGLPLFTGLAFALFAFSHKRTYTSTTTFMPQASDASRASLSGLAAQFGVVVPPSGAVQSPDFFARVLESRSLLEEASQVHYPPTDGARPPGTTLDVIWDVKKATPAETMDFTVLKLDEAVATQVARQTGIVTMTVRTESGALSDSIAITLLTLLNRFNIERRHSQAGQERVFNERSLETARAALLAAEGALQSFLSTNRGDYRSSPQLAFSYDRLRREVDMRQTIVTSLSESYERVKMDEVRDTPVLTIIDPPHAKKNSRGTVSMAIVGVFVGGLLALVIAFGSDYLKRLRESPEYAVRLQSLLKPSQE
jgi:uncharacterized protein involved in exopolysaccharide biosynthesis